MYKTTIPVIVSYPHFDRDGVLDELHRSGAHRIALALDREMGTPFPLPKHLKT